MSNALFVLIVFGVGLLLAIYVDRLRSRRGGGGDEPGGEGERSRWLHFWYTGNFPDDSDKDGKGGRKG